MQEIRMGIMCPLCYRVDYADETGLDEMLTTTDLAWLNGWRTSDLGPVCPTCGKDRDEQ